MKLKLPQKADPDIDMAPMIDMVFLLLIFFMVASVVKELDKKEVDIPLSRHATIPEDLKGRFAVSVADDGTMYDGLREIDMETLKKRIVQEMDPDQGGVADLKVQIRSAANVQYKINKGIMQACADVGAMDIIYATFEE